MSKISIQNNNYANMQYSVVSNETPIVFLDTSIFIYLAKEENQELYNQLQTKVDNNEIIILACNQELEFIRNNLEKDFPLLKMFFRLTAGYYIDKKLVENHELSIYANEIFSELEEDDDVKEGISTKINLLMEASYLVDSRYVLSRNLKKVMDDSLWNQIMNRNPKESKEKLLERLENIAENVADFEDFMITELAAERITIENEISKYEFIPDFTDEEILSDISNEFTKTAFYTAKLYILTFAKPKSYEQYLACLAEFYVYYMVYTPPHKFIFARIFGYLFFNGKIASGDYKDIEYLSHYLPYCDYYFTDKKMCNIARELKLDEIFCTQILRLKDLTKLI